MTDPSPAFLLGRLMFALERESDRLLQTQVGVSYKRFLFLTVLRECGTVTQHELAVALGYSDPAVSTMLVELAKDDYAQTIPSPDHGRKRLVSITATGSDLVAHGRSLLDAHFDQLTTLADVDAHNLRDAAERLYLALKTKTQEQYA